jgi:signal transduction histidine kinase
MQPGSLSFRLFLLNSLWAAISIALVAFLLSQAYRQNAERRFAELATANLYNLMGSIEPGADGKLVGAPQLGDSRFSNFGSGWYWSVASEADPKNRLQSQSLADGEIPAPQGVIFDENFQRNWTYIDSQGQRITAVEGRVFLGTGSEIYSFRVTGNRGDLDEEISGFARTMVALLALFGLGMVLASFIIVRIGLWPINGATLQLSEIREGRAERLEGRFPREIAPLIEETNALIESNRSVIGRARTQVGNLAHSLKTPLAVLQNEAASAPPSLGRLMLEQTRLMQDQVQAYLDRARIAARHATVTSRTNAIAVIDRLVRVIAKLNPSISVVREGDDAPIFFAGEAEDLEQIAGNLLENGAKFAKTRLAARLERVLVDGKPRFRLEISDDGPGMTAEQTQLALKRGMRLDESVPGSGLGLSIVKDIVGEYGGELQFGRSAQGGLLASVVLPAR